MDDIRPPRARPPQQSRQSNPQPRPALPMGKIELLLPKTTKLPMQRRTLWRWVIGTIALLMLLFAASAAGAWWWYNAALQPHTQINSRVRIVVAPGETAETIGAELQTKGVISSALVFGLYVKQQGALHNLKAGTYLFSPTQSVPEIVEWLVSGKVDSFNLTILPDKTLADIKTALVKDGFDANAIDAALAKTYNHPLLKDKPADVNLEGYIFPDTYTITSETTPEQLFTRAFDVLYAHIQAEGLQNKLAVHGLNLHQGITLASIVQREVNTLADRRQAAQVFERRLSIGMPLGSDVTFMYAARLLGQEPSVSIESPYNTRKYTGLPPGAISNFTASSLQAVADPAEGDYLYFVAGDDGKTYFSRTQAEHETNVAQHCTKLCQ